MSNRPRIQAYASDEYDEARANRHKENAPEALQRIEGEDQHLAKGSIMNQFTHKTEDGIETYAFPSALHPDQRHFIQRVDDALWTICIVDTTPDLTLEQSITLMAELEYLCDFLVKLNGTELHRRTAPGNPSFEEDI